MMNTIYRVAVPNGTPRKVTDNAWTDAAVSPDGKQIAFINQNVGAREHALFVINTDDTNERKVASHLLPNYFAIYGSYVA
ncbi:MAG: TolB family protein [Pyrinomonadaceae bacterium]